LLVRPSRVHARVSRWRLASQSARGVYTPELQCRQQFLFSVLYALPLTEL
jgi:hypothetical protein